MCSVETFQAKAKESLVYFSCFFTSFDLLVHSSAPVTVLPDAFGSLNAVDLFELYPFKSRRGTFIENILLICLNFISFSYLSYIFFQYMQSFKLAV